MNYVTFNDYHSYLDFHLFLSSKEIEAPAIKTLEVDIDGIDGAIDFTTYFGDTFYKNRKINLEFSLIEPHTDFLKIFSSLLNTLHGKKMKIAFSDDEDFYYLGRIEVDKYKSSGRIGKIALSCECEPYKYKNSVTSISDVITATKSIVCHNLRKAVVPKITVTGEATIKFGDYSKSVSSGTYEDDNIIFLEGQNVITVTPISSEVNIVIEYQERGL